MATTTISDYVIWAKQIHDDHEALAKALAPLVDDAGFDLTTGLQTAADGLEAAVMKTHLNDLADKQLVAFRTMLELAADSNLALGVLIEGANIPSKDLLPPVVDRFAAAANRLDKSLAAHLSWAKPLGVTGDAGLRVADNGLPPGLPAVARRGPCAPGDCRPR